MGTRALLAAVAAVASSGGTVLAADQTPRTFGVVDLSDPPAGPGVRQRVEREVAAKGLAAIPDPTTQRALGAAETTGATARRLLQEAAGARQQGDCAAALARASEAEQAALSGLPADEARQPARAALGIVLACADALGRADDAGRAATRLRRIGPEPPAVVPRGVWERYAAPARPARAVELTVDSEPANAHVSVNFHAAGTTPLTVDVPAGEVTVEVEKDGYQKVFRRLQAPGPSPARVTVPLTERRRDRAGEIVRRVLALRGSDPTSRRQTVALMAQVSQLARVDVLVAFAAHADDVTVWWFDAERGDFVGPPAVLPAH